MSQFCAATCANRSSANTTFVRWRKRGASSYRHSDIARLPVFTNIVKESFLQELADADEGELIKQVQVSPDQRE